ncbi:MAG: large conductance mechanosensitive channel protein MscL [Ruminococcus sp.]|nr:large conductance mechanosensitive channel protein MscL [Ruminococcus sp.]
MYHVSKRRSKKGSGKAKAFLTEFKDMISKGNVVDMAVGVIIGSAFSSIVTSLVNDIIMPFISLITSGINFEDWKWVLKEAVLDEAGEVATAEVAVTFGNFISVVLNFLIVALCIFLVIKLIGSAKNKVKKAEEPAPEAPAEPVITELDVLKSIEAKLDAIAEKK